MCWNIQKNVKNIHNIIDRNLKQDYRISIIFVTNIFDATGY